MKIEFPEKKIRKRIFITVIVLIIIIFFFGNKNFRSLLALHKEKKRLAQYLDVLKDENADIKEKIEMYKNDPEYLEDLAREKLGMIKQGEIKYKFINIDKFK